MNLAQFSPAAQEAARRFIAVWHNPKTTFEEFEAAQSRFWDECPKEEQAEVEEAIGF